jgi:PPE-repeat protein
MVFSDFAALPPEVISTQIYSGPGAGSLLAAAAAWDGLAAELHSTAASYTSVISELVGESWQGQSSESMAAAAEPYVAWMSATAGQAEETAAQARAAASAYEAALAATVPPALVAANRSQLAALLETNILGQNDATIAVTEDEYGQMWAQDVAAMFSYASASESAGELTAFEEAPATTNDTAAVTQTAAAATAQSQSLSSWLKQLEDYLTSLSSQYTQFWQNLIGGATGSTEIAPLWEALYSSIGQIGTQATWTNVVNASSSLGISQWKNFFIYAPWSAAMAKTSLGAGLASPGHVAAAVPVKPVSAVLGNAPTVGKLSVPPSWATATPAIRLASTALPATSWAAAAAADIPAALVNEATLGSLAGGALGSPASRVVSSTGIQARAITGERRTGPVKLDRIIAQLQEMPDQVQHWNVDEAGLDDLVAKLRTTPGVHAVHVTDGEEIAVGGTGSKRG